MILHAFDDMKTHDLMYSDYMIMVISSTSPDPLDTMGITTYAIRSIHALHGYLYHRVGDMPTIPMETTSSRYMVCAQRMVPWYEDPKWVEIHVLGVPKHVLRVGIGTGLAHLGHYGT